MNPQNTAPDVESLVRKLVAQFVGLAPDDVTPDLRVVEDLGLESIDAVELLIVAERETGEEFEVEDLHGIETVGDLIDTFGRRINSVEEPDHA